MLREITVSIDHLLLDPNNPRFVKDCLICPEVKNSAEEK